MHELKEQTQPKERAIDSLPSWMRQMLEEKMQRCLKAEAEERSLATKQSEMQDQTRPPKTA